MNGPSSGSEGVRAQGARAQGARAEGARAESAGFGRAAGVALVAALLWGVWWIPVRDLEALGFADAWASVAINLGAVPIAAAALLFVRGAPPMTARGLFGAALVGCAVALYGGAVAMTDIVRAVLLFYLAPVWAVAIECAFMGRKLRLVTVAALGLAAVGVFAMFRGDVSLAGWGVGDGAAVASGMFWAAGSAFLFSQPRFSPLKMSLATFLAAAAFSALLALALGNPQPAAGVAASAAPWALLYGGAFFLPIIVATLWSAARLTPTMLSLLLAAEIVSGVGSSALLLDERFGWPEALGAALIAIAVTLEGLISRANSRAPTPAHG